ncbi:hypothetical protein pipiens_016896 [Culex pipiens pipiens]|uniref:ATPase AAA-type core domain-containing protein n=1 Tax=Culex pipiens pipiens TaxID=38569 RepID=A0ABD1CJ62_CULPP
MDYDENANLAPGYVAAVTTAIKRMLPERERQQLLVERRKTDQDRLKQLAKKVVVDDKVSDGIGEPASVHSCTSVTAELRSNPSLSARTRVPELAVEYYTVLRAQAKGPHGWSREFPASRNNASRTSRRCSIRQRSSRRAYSSSTNRVTAQKDMERRIVAQLGRPLRIEEGDKVLVIGATNRRDALDPALRRSGSFEQEIWLETPEREARAWILKITKLEQTIDYDELAGYVGAALLALVTRTAANANSCWSRPFASITWKSCIAKQSRNYSSNLSRRSSTMTKSWRGGISQEYAQRMMTWLRWMMTLRRS